jgi:hypothetical protein
MRKRGSSLFENQNARFIPILGASLLALMLLVPAAAGDPRPMHSGAARVASVATVETRDFRVAVVAYRVSGGAAPTAEVRLAIAQRATGGGWRERGERRLDGTYFWRTVSGPRSVCKLEIATPGTLTSVRPHVTVQLLVSPSLGCGRAHRFPLPSR